MALTSSQRCPNCGNTEEDDEMEGKEGREWHGCNRRKCGQWYHADCLPPVELASAEAAVQAAKNSKDLKRKKKAIPDETRKASSWWCPLCKVTQRIKLIKNPQ